MSASFQSRRASRLVFRLINWALGGFPPPQGVPETELPLFSAGDETAWSKVLQKISDEDKLYAEEQLRRKFPNLHIHL